MDDTKRVFMMLIPKDTLSDICDDYNLYPIESQFGDNHDYQADALCHPYLSHHYISPCNDSMRLDPSMMAVSAMASFSDKHESVDFPIVAANIQYLILPRQSRIRCVLKPEFDDNRFSYTISGGFMGRLCRSGDIFGLSENLYEEIPYTIGNIGESMIG